MIRTAIFSLLIALVGLAGSSTATFAGASAPQRIVSLNMCLDPLLLSLVPRERIAGMTTLSADPSLSAIVDEVGSVPLVSGTAEEVVALDPDLVLVGRFGAGNAAAILRRLGRRVVEIPMATDFTGLVQTIALVAEAVGATERGREIAAQMTAALERARSGDSAGRRPTALAYQVGGIASGQGSFVDELMTKAGLSNAVGATAPTRSGRVELEVIATRPPDLLLMVMGAQTYRTRLADNLRHPALAGAMARGVIADLPMPQWLCPVPASAKTVERLAHLARRAADAPRSLAAALPAR